MQTPNIKAWLTHTDCDFEEFKTIVSAEPAAESHPMAEYCQQRIPVYSGRTIRENTDNTNYLHTLLAEWNQVLDTGAGIIVIKGAYADQSLLTRVTEILQSIIATETATNKNAADHFASPGANSRVWNAHEKLAVASPELFTAYYANPIMHLASQAWLGPGYQITAQVNVVHPGGHAQVCHRDYHLGFQSIEQLSAFPLNVQRLSPHLTLQGAIAHSDMTIESGPTKVLPFSQRYTQGYMAAQLPKFRDYFENHYAQLPLICGDIMFFNPAVFHAAGDNNTNQDRFANLLQIGSAFGRTTELVDRAKLCRLIYPVLLAAHKNQSLSNVEISNVIAASAEGYAFPCNLDLTPPVNGLAPDNQQQLIMDYLVNGKSALEFNHAIDQWVGLRCT